MIIRTADLCDRYGSELDVLEPGLRHYGRLQRFHGPIATVVVFEDNLLVRQALEEPGNGRVLVVDGGASDRRALLGDKLASIALQNGWTGILINGCIRDSATIAGLDLGVMALGTCPLPSDKDGEGRRDEMVRFNAVSMSPEHYLYADEDGIVVAERQLPG